MGRLLTWLMRRLAEYSLNVRMCPRCETWRDRCVVECDSCELLQTWRAMHPTERIEA